MRDRHTDCGAETNLPVLRQPAALTGWRAHLDGSEVVVLEWPTERADPVPGLGQSEREVLALVLAGLSSARIAATRGRARKTVENQLASVFEKLGVRGRLELFARFAAPPGEVST